MLVLLVLVMILMRGVFLRTYPARIMVAVVLLLLLLI